MNKKYFGYVRISDDKQKKGVSPKVQRRDISAFASNRDIDIVEWFVEIETAAKAGRRIFTKMLARLEKGEAEGVIFHKIDRSARNLDDWNMVGRLVDRGIDVQFVHESLDLKTRSGRLSADIIAVVAADYIRNLREEARKGLYGRLNQGIYPLAAPVGYLDRGKGMVKEIDPERAPHVQWAFVRYSGGTVGLRQLRIELRARGLRSKKQKPLSLNCISRMLTNPFYMGILRLRTTGEAFEGKHVPIVTKSVFERVQSILQGKMVRAVVKHDFVFRRRITCAGCGLHLIGETQKGHTYFRCQKPSCKGTSVREELVDDLVHKSLKLLVGNDREMREIREMVEVERQKADGELDKVRIAIEMLLAKCDDRLTRLTDALIDQLIDKEIFESRKMRALKERRGLLDQLESASNTDLPRHRAFANLELSNAAYSGYKMGNLDERRRLLDRFTSNLSVQGKNVAITLKSPFKEIADWRNSQKCAPLRGTPQSRAAALLDIIMAADPESISQSVTPNSTPGPKPGSESVAIHATSP